MEIPDFYLTYELVHAEAKPPRRATEWSAAYDLYTPVPITIFSGVQLAINIGVRMQFPFGWAAQIWDRSGVGAKGIAKHCGLLDPDYPKDWIVQLRNHSDYPIEFKVGDRIAQVCFVPCGTAEPQPGIIQQVTDRVGGFNSTGA